MKLFTTLTLIGIFFLLLNCGSNRTNSELATLEDSLSYFVGVNIAVNQLMGLRDDIDLEMFMKGVKDYLNNKPLLLIYDDGEIIFTKLEIKRRQKDQELAASNLEMGKQFMEQYKKQKGVITTKSGLLYQVTEKGNGLIPTKNDKVILRYRGTTIDGTEFDSSSKQGGPQTFAINSVIKGFSEVLQLVNVGSKFEAVIPSDLAYGKEGHGIEIGPNEVLIFQVELLGIE